MHVVRHPLPFLSSNFAFGQCVECWAVIETLTVPPIKAHTAHVREQIRRLRISNFEYQGGREWPAMTKKTLLEVR